MQRLRGAAAAMVAKGEEAGLARLREEYVASVPDKIQQQAVAAVRREVDWLNLESFLLLLDKACIT